MVTPLLPTDALTLFDGYSAPVVQWLHWVEDAVNMENIGPASPGQVISMAYSLLTGSADTFVTTTPELANIISRGIANEARDQDLRLLFLSLETRFSGDLTEPSQEAGEPILIYYSRALCTVERISWSIVPNTTPEMTIWPDFVGNFIRGLHDELVRILASTQIQSCHTLAQAMAVIRVVTEIVEV